ncbi:MAG: hypothetical protein ABSD20_05100 [Terriglobales bacterium]
MRRLIFVLLLMIPVLWTVSSQAQTALTESALVGKWRSVVTGPGSGGSMYEYLEIFPEGKLRWHQFFGGTSDMASSGNYKLIPPDKVHLDARNWNDDFVVKMKGPDKMTWTPPKDRYSGEQPRDWVLVRCASPRCEQMVKPSAPAKGK